MHHHTARCKGMLVTSNDDAMIMGPRCSHPQQLHDQPCSLQNQVNVASTYSGQIPDVIQFRDSQSLQGAKAIKRFEGQTGSTYLFSLI